MYEKFWNSETDVLTPLLKIKWDSILLIIPCQLKRPKIPMNRMSKIELLIIGSGVEIENGYGCTLKSKMTSRFIKRRA